MLKRIRPPIYKGPVLMVIMDGVGLCDREVGNAVRQAYTPTLDALMASRPTLALKAHGTAVGLPSDDDMGNSEVGHNAMGAGRVYDQGAKLVNAAIESGRIFRGAVWRDLMGRCAGGAGGAGGAGTLHLIGLLSDGYVHSHIDQLKALVAQAKKDGAGRVRIHILLDGRDVGETSALEYVLPFEKFLAELNSGGASPGGGGDAGGAAGAAGAAGGDAGGAGGFSARIASGGGRMRITMDRYEANWKMVEDGWNTHVHAVGRQFPTAEAAILEYRSHGKVIDQDLPAFVVADDGVPVGPIRDGDGVVFFNFRGDRAIEISRAFGDEGFRKFDRGRVPDVLYAGMLEYDGDLHIPRRYLVDPPEIRDTLAEHLCASGVRQFAAAETQKFGHVTYFWNGNRSGKFSDALETYIEAPSDVVPFEQRPWMKAAEVTDALMREAASGGYGFARVNFANGDMVGHTGNFAATRIAVETVDLCLARILPAIDAIGGMAIVTADHGNADEMYELDKKTGQPAIGPDGAPKAKTSHTLSKVPCIFYDNSAPGAYEVVPGDYGLSSFASTICGLLGFEPLAAWDPPMLRMK